MNSNQIIVNAMKIIISNGKYHVYQLTQNVKHKMKLINGLFKRKFSWQLLINKYRLINNQILQRGYRILKVRYRIQLFLLKMRLKLLKQFH